MDILQVEHVVKQYAGHRALDDVSLVVPQGTIYGLLGPNGAGKTTLIRIINGITAPDSGQVLLKGKRITMEEVLRIGYLPEERGLYKKMKVGEQAMFLARLKGLSTADAKKALRYWFEKFGIQDWWNKKVEELSKGMAQKVQFITTILHKPELLILDEPFSGFDPVNAELIKNEILNLKAEGTTIVLSTHNMSSVEELCDNISLVNKSHIVLQGNVEEIRRTHTTHTFRLLTDGHLPAELSGLSVTPVKEGRLNEYLVRKSEELSNNQLLKILMDECNVVGFEEMLPTMNEIFINTVSQNA
ncbi:MAG: ATP-binding cassette domain-containing protein [Bacteroidetes bacterium]|uniref:ATP-binding cassette domain-containing protein n=1 Tax=Candidatus Gallipaludibacter merdavium TaxID=2840839 RepID=A0A9D9HSV1_9BACT|nr:ATP-binding cassette domain-containing protein [Candidatus Gallipaludibacter merdavium]